MKARYKAIGSTIDRRGASKADQRQDEGSIVLVGLLFEILGKGQWGPDEIGAVVPGIGRHRQGLFRPLQKRQSLQARREGRQQREHCQKDLGKPDTEARLTQDDLPWQKARTTRTVGVAYPKVKAADLII